MCITTITTKKTNFKEDVDIFPLFLHMMKKYIMKTIQGKLF